MRHRIAWVVVSFLGAAGVAAAQTQSAPPPVNPPAQGAPLRGVRAGQRNPGAAQLPPGNVNQVDIQVTEQWNTLVLRRSKMALGLSAQQFPQFFDKMTDLQNVRDRHQKERHRMVNELGRLTRPEGSPVDDATLTGRTKDLDDAELMAAQQERQALAAVDALLTPFQRARFRVFEENMEKQKLTMLAAAMAVRPTPGPPKPPKPPDH